MGRITAAPWIPAFAGMMSGPRDRHQRDNTLPQQPILQILPNPLHPSSIN